MHCLQDLTEKHSQSVVDHASYNEAYRKVCDWMNGAEQKLSKLAEDGGDTVDAVRHQLGAVKVNVNC